MLKGLATPEKEYAFENEATVEEDGTFLIVFKPRDYYTLFQLSVRFNPEIQPDDIKKKYGKFGEKIGDSDGIFEYESNGTQAFGIVKYAPIGTLNDGFYDGKYTLAPEIQNAKKEL